MNKSSLSPTFGRLRTAVAGGGWRSLRVRRAAAAALVLAATALIVVDQRTPDAPPVVIAAADIRPGSVLDADDVTTVAAPRSLTPPGALTRPGDAVGRRVTGPVRRGEMVTADRLLNSRLPESITGDDTARLVAVRPADETVIALVRQGDLIDVLDADATVLARSAVVAVAPQSASAQGVTRSASGSQPVLLAMDEDSAHRVAATGLGTPLALILH